MGFFFFFFLSKGTSAREKCDGNLFSLCSIARSLARVQINIPQSIFSIVIVENRGRDSLPLLTLYFSPRVQSLSEQSGGRKRTNIRSPVSSQRGSTRFIFYLCTKKDRWRGREGGKGSPKSPGTIFTKTLRGSIARISHARSSLLKYNDFRRSGRWKGELRATVRERNSLSA